MGDEIKKGKISKSRKKDKITEREGKPPESIVLQDEEKKIDEKPEDPVVPIEYETYLLGLKGKHEAVTLTLPKDKNFKSWIKQMVVKALPEKQEMDQVYDNVVLLEIVSKDQLDKIRSLSREQHTSSAKALETFRSSNYEFWYSSMATELTFSLLKDILRAIANTPPHMKAPREMRIDSSKPVAIRIFESVKEITGFYTNLPLEKVVVEITPKNEPIEETKEPVSAT